MASNREIIVVAAGGHGRVLIDALLASGASIRGLVDPALTAGNSVMDTVVLGGDEVLDSEEASQCWLANGLGANPSTMARATAYRCLVARGYRFVTVVHPTAVIGRASELGEGCQIMARAVVQCGARIGRNVVVNTAASLDHDAIIGDDAFIAPGAILCGNVQLGVGVFVGAGAILLPGVRVGAGAVIAAGALVRSEVPAGMIYAGVPAREHRKI